MSGDSKARSHLRSITSFDFIVSLVVCEHVLQATTALSVYLQGKSCDLLEAVRESMSVIRILKDERNDDNVWQALFDVAVEMAENVGVVPSKPRVTSQQIHRVNVPSASVSEYWKRALYYPLIDHLLEDLETRMIKPSARFVAQNLLPSTVAKITEQDTNDIFVQYQGSLTVSKAGFQYEVKRWVARWSLESSKPDSLQKTIKR